MATNDEPWDCEVFACGTYPDVGGKDRTFREADLEEMVRNFSALYPAVQPMLKLGHGSQILAQENGQPALGWITKLRRVGSKLVATFSQVPSVLRDALRAGRWKRVSAEINLRWESPSNLTERNLRSGATGKVLEAVALLGADAPMVSNLQDISALMENTGTEDRLTASMPLYENDLETERRVVAHQLNTLRDELRAFTEQTSGPTKETTTTMPTTLDEFLTADEKAYLAQGLNDHCSKVYRERAGKRLTERLEADHQRTHQERVLAAQSAAITAEEQREQEYAEALAASMHAVGCDYEPGPNDTKEQHALFQRALMRLSKLYPELTGGRVTQGNPRLTAALRRQDSDRLIARKP